MINENDKIGLLTKVFDNLQALISNADNKANIALSIQTFITTTVLGAAIIVDTLNKIAEYSCFIKLSYYFLFTSFLISSVIGLTLCINVFKPRPPQEGKEIKRKGITYFGHIKKFNNSNEYLDEINDTKLTDLIKEFASQNFSLALILNHKMKFVKYSVTLLFINILLGIALLIFSLITK